jgi:hypothetical protein
MYNMDEVLISDGGNTEDLYDRFYITDRIEATIEMETTFGAEETDGTITTVDFPFKIKAVAEGGAYIWKEFLARIVVCRYEQVTIVTNAVYSDTLQVRQDSGVPYSTDGLFASNDTDFCPVNTFEIVLSDDDYENAVRRNSA